MGADAPNSLGSGAAQLLIGSAATVDLNGNDLTIVECFGGGTITDTASTAGTSTLTLLLSATSTGETGTNFIDGPHRNIAVVYGGQGDSGTAWELLTSNGAYTGGTMIDANTLVWLGWGGVTGTISGNVVNNGQFDFAPATTLTFNGMISGSGTVGIGAYWGNGVVILTAANTYSGATYVGAGTLDVTGSLAGGTVFVQAGGTLSGSGTVGDVSVQGGVLSAGNGSPGVLTTGNLTLDSYSQLAVTINGGTAGTGYSQVQANGSVNLGGSTLNLTGTGAASSSGPIVLIQSTGGVTGTFAGLAEGATVTYQGTTYQITYQYNPAGGTGTDVALVPV